MTQSMTGYGRAEKMIDGRRIQAEIKSVNHRYLEIAVRLPSAAATFEQDIRRLVAARCQRGKVDVAIRVEAGEAADVRLALNLPLARAYADLLGRLKTDLGLAGDVTLETILALRDVVRLEEAEEDPDRLRAPIEAVLAEAMDTLVAMREKEGAALGRDLLERLQTLEWHREAVAARVPAVVREFQKRLADRIRELTGGVDLEEGRLAQEVAVMAERSDITEELVRLGSHAMQFRGLLEQNEAAGRKLDFLLQEMNREVNTLGAKSGDAGIARHVIEMKSELGKLREQVQNLV